MKKLIVIAALAALSGAAMADSGVDPMWACVNSFAVAHPGAFYKDVNGQSAATAEGDAAVRHCAVLVADGTHPYTAHGTLIMEDGTIVDAVDMRPLPGLEKSGKSERIRMLQQRSTKLFEQAAQQSPPEKWETLDAAEQTEVLMIKLAQCVVGLRTECNL
jgi:hypothetical protein